MKPNPNDPIPTHWSLIERLKNCDDQTSWREFFNTYWRLIHGVAIKSGLTEAEAQDVVQETVISVCRNLPKFKADPSAGSFKAWLLQLTRWRIIDQVRKRPTEELARAHRAATQPRTETNSTATEERIPDPAGNFLDAIWEEEWRENLVAAALERIKPEVSAKHFQVFYLHVLKELPAEKVAHALGIEIAQVYLIKSRLLRLFQKAVSDLETKVL